MVSAGRWAGGGCLLRSGVTPDPSPDPPPPPLPPVRPASVPAASTAERGFPGPLAPQRPFASHPGRACEPLQRPRPSPRGGAASPRERSRPSSAAKPCLAAGLALTQTAMSAAPWSLSRPQPNRFFPLYWPSPGFPWGGSPCSDLQCLVCQDNISLSSDLLFYWVCCLTSCFLSSKLNPDTGCRSRFSEA